MISRACGNPVKLFKLKNHQLYYLLLKIPHKKIFRKVSKKCETNQIQLIRRGTLNTLQFYPILFDHGVDQLEVTVILPHTATITTAADDRSCIDLDF